MSSHSKDLTHGPLGLQVLFFSFPLIVTNLLQVLFNVADIAVVGRFAGAMALGSVGSTSVIVAMFTSFLIGMASGINVLVALYSGAKDRKSVKETVHTALILSVLAGLTLLIVGGGLARLLLALLNTKSELIDGAVLYLRIYFVGMPALAIYNFGNAVFSASGDTKRPLLYLSMAGVVNVILNLFFVIVCQMGVAGVALSSIISQYISAVLVTAALFRSKKMYALSIADLKLNRGKAKNILKISVPAGFQNAIFYVANLFVQAGINSFSATIVAANSAAANADNIVYDVMAAFYTACGSFMGQNYGAGNKRRVRNSYLITLAYSFGIGMAMGVLLVIFGKPFLSVFTTDEEVIAVGLLRMKIMGLSYAFSALIDCTVAGCRALGKSLLPMVFVIVGVCAFRIIWIYTIFAYFHTLPSLYLLFASSWIFTGIAEVIYFINVYKNQTADLK